MKLLNSRISEKTWDLSQHYQKNIGTPKKSGLWSCKNTVKSPPQVARISSGPTRPTRRSTRRWSTTWRASGTPARPWWAVRICCRSGRPRRGADRGRLDVGWCGGFQLIMGVPLVMDGLFHGKSHWNEYLHDIYIHGFSWIIRWFSTDLAFSRGFCSTSGAFQLIMGVPLVMDGLFHGKSHWNEYLHDIYIHGFSWIIRWFSTDLAFSRGFCSTSGAFQLIMGVPLVIIHFRWGFSLINQAFWGSPWRWKPPCCHVLGAMICYFVGWDDGVIYTWYLAKHHLIFKAHVRLIVELAQGSVMSPTVLIMDDQRFFGVWNQLQRWFLLGSERVEQSIAGPVMPNQKILITSEPFEEKTAYLFWSWTGWWFGTSILFSH